MAERLVKRACGFLYHPLRNLCQIGKRIESKGIALIIVIPAQTKNLGECLKQEFISI